MLADLPLLLGRPRIPSTMRLAGERALVVTATLERRGWRAEAVYLVGQLYLIEARDPSVKGHPLVATLRTEDDYEGFRRQYPGQRPASRRRPRGTPGGWWVVPEPLPTGKGSPLPASATWPEVAALRKAMGIGHRSLARRLGVPRSTLEYAELRQSRSESAARLAREAMAMLHGQAVANA